MTIEASQAGAGPAEAGLEAREPRRLPISLEATPDAFQADTAVSDWSDVTFFKAYTTTRRMELRPGAEMDLTTQCQSYAEVY